jgi:hypothetical protein
MTSNPPELLHLDYRPPSAAWGLPLQSQLNGSKSAVLRERYRSWKESRMAEAGLAVATRLMLVSRALHRLAELEDRLCKEIDRSGKLDSLLAGGYVYTPEDPNSVYDICVAVDGVLTECLSLMEVIKVFTVRFCRKILRTEMSKKEFDALLVALGYGGEWLDTLIESRNFFLHQSAPWLALQIDGRDPLVCTLIVLKSNVRDLSDPNTFISKLALVGITRGMTRAVWGIQEWLSEAIVKDEASE